MQMKFFVIAFLSILMTSSAKAAPETTGQSTTTVQPEEKPSPAPTVEFGMKYRSDLAQSVTGGADKKTAFLGNLDLLAKINLEKALELKGLSLLAEGIATHGDALSQSVGDTQVTSNIEGPQTAKIYQAYLEQAFLRERVSLLAGVHDLNTDFYVTPASGTLLNSSFGLGPEFSHSGVTGPSIYPNTAVGARIKAKIAEPIQLQAGIYDGVPGDPANPKGTHIRLDRKDGFLLIAETDVSYAVASLGGQVGLGGWRYSEKLDHLTETTEAGDALKEQSQGVFLTAEQKFYQPEVGSPRGAWVFVRAGYASPETNPISYSLVGGVKYQGWLSSRPEDIWSLGVSAAGASTFQKRRLTSEGAKASPRETAIELTYRAQITPWFAVQPDIQWVQSPSFHEEIADAIVAGGRLEIAL